MNESPERNIEIESLDSHLQGLILSKFENHEFVNVPCVSHKWSALSQSYSVLRARYQDTKLPQEQRQALFNKMLNLDFNQKQSIGFFAKNAFYTKLYFKKLEQQLPKFFDMNEMIMSFMGEIIILDVANLNENEDIEYINDMLKKLKAICAMREELNLAQITQSALMEIEAIKEHYPFAYEVISSQITNDHKNEEMAKNCKRFIEILKQIFSGHDIQQTFYELKHQVEIQLIKRGNPNNFLIFGDLCKNNLELNNLSELNLISMLGLTPQIHIKILDLMFEIFKLDMKNDPVTPQNSHLIKEFEDNVSNLFIDTFCPNGLLSYTRVNLFILSHKLSKATSTIINPLADIDGLIESDSLQLCFPDADKDDIIQRRAAIMRAVVIQQSTVRAIDEVSGTTKQKSKRQKRSFT